MKLSINRIIKYLILSDLIFYAGWGLINPIFAIFIVEKIQGGDLIVIGTATSIYWITMSLVRIPLGMFLDKRRGEKDDYAFTVLGLLLAALIPFGYLYITLPWHLYVLQVIYACSMAMSLAGWSAIFTRNIDKGHEATEWSLSATGYSLGTGVAGIIGGYTVEKFGFNPTFIGVGILGLIGVILLLVIKQDVTKEKWVPGSFYFSFKELFNK